MYEASPTRVGCKLNVKKPFVVQDHDDMKRQMKKMGVNMQPKNQTEDTAIKIRETLLKKGFDAIEVRKHQYFIPLNQDQVAVFEAKKAN
jgi:hypothetical protein